MLTKEETLRLLNEHEDDIAEHIVNAQLRDLNFSKVQRQASLRDAKENIKQLAIALAIDSPMTFNAYVVWLNTILTACLKGADELMYQEKLMMKDLTAPSG